jgi:hypothetical protein
MSDAALTRWQAGESFFTLADEAGVNPVRLWLVMHGSQPAPVKPRQAPPPPPIPSPTPPNPKAAQRALEAPVAVRAPDKPAVPLVEKYRPRNLNGVAGQS